MKQFLFRANVIALAVAIVLVVWQRAEAKSTLAYISDSPSSSVPFWVAKDAGIFKKHGLDVDMLFINGSTRGIQSLIAGDLNFTGAVGTSAINGRLAGGERAVPALAGGARCGWAVGGAGGVSSQGAGGRWLKFQVMPGCKWWISAFPVLTY